MNCIVFSTIYELHCIFYHHLRIKLDFVYYLILCHILIVSDVLQDEDDDDGDEGFGLDTVTESMMIAKMQVN